MAVRAYWHQGNIRDFGDGITPIRVKEFFATNSLSIQTLATVNATLTAKRLPLKSGAVVDATLIAAPSSAKNSTDEGDSEMHQTIKGNQWRFGTKTHIGVDADSGPVHAVLGTAANVNDVTQAYVLVHSDGTEMFADAGYQGVEKREEMQDINVNWHVAMRPGKRKVLDKSTPMGAIMEKLKKAKANICAIGEHSFRVVKRQFGHVKV